MRPSFLALAAALLAPAALAAQQEVVAGPLGARLDSVMRAAAAQGFSGVARIEQAGTLLLDKGYGLADRGRRVPYRRTTVVPIGSNTKDMTRLLVMRLASRGRLALDDSLGRFFADAPADKRGITLRQLLEHRGGFPIGIGADAEPLTRDAFVRRAMATPLRARPGTQEIYSNTGYALLAAVLEQVTGTSYERLVHDDLLAPLGLHETGYLLPRFEPQRVARGYDHGRDRGNALEHPHAPDGPWWNLRGNGGMLSTVDDMHAFYDALFTTDRLIPLAGRNGVFDPAEPVGLAGSDLVHFFLYERVPAGRTEMILASNDAEYPAPRLRDALARVLGLPDAHVVEEKVAAAPPEGAQPPAPAVDSLVRDFVAAVTAGDSTAIARFVTTRFDLSGGPPAEARIARFRGMHDRLGPITFVRAWVAEPGVVQATVQTSAGPGTLVFNLASGSGAAPPRIASIGVMIGG